MCVYSRLCSLLSSRELYDIMATSVTVFHFRWMPQKSTAASHATRQSFQPDSFGFSSYVVRQGDEGL